MQEEIKDTQGFLVKISNAIHYFMVQNLPEGFVLYGQIFGKLMLLLLVIFIVDFIFKLLINSIFSRLFTSDRYPVLQSVYRSKITNSVAHLLAILWGSYALYPIFKRHPDSFEFLDRMIGLGILMVCAGMVYRSIDAFRRYFIIQKDYYKVIAINAVSQTVKIFGIVTTGVIAVCVIFGIKGPTIVGSLGAITAVLVLVFRDTILGFVTGIHVATSKNLKVGDWIGIPKYQIEGCIEEISLLTTKILNFDKTISTIPTYDLLSTEIKNMQVMTESNTRRIKRSIIFNINSFKFLDQEKIDELMRINLLTEYLLAKKTEILRERTGLANAELLINGRQLTNIGVFREYAEQFLRHNEHIDQGDTLIVRQMESTPQGMPLEIYCFTNDSTWSNYEEIQSDIFDHLLVASRVFDLEVMQTHFKI